MLHVNFPVPLHSLKDIVYCDMADSFIIGPFFIEEHLTAAPVTSTVIVACLEAIINDRNSPYSSNVTF